MRNECLAPTGAVAGVIALMALTWVPVTGQTTSAAATTTASTTGTPLRTPWGEPDLQGVWKAATLTPLERPSRYAGRPFITDKEVAEVLALAAKDPGKDRRATRGSERDVAGAYIAVFNEHANTLAGGNRTSLIVDPPNGLVPPLTEEAKKREEMEKALVYGHATAPWPATYKTIAINRNDNPEDRNLRERCLGPLHTANFGGFRRIVQSPGYVTIYDEEYSSQIIPLDGRPHLPQHIRQWFGDARGRWERNTLVVDVTNFSPRTNLRGSRENLHLIERFTRVDANTLNYEVTVDDPTTFTKPWTIAMPLPKLDEAQRHWVYDYECQEGNYGMLGILAGARAAEKAFAEGRGPDPSKFDTVLPAGGFANLEGLTVEQ